MRARFRVWPVVLVFFLLLLWIETGRGQNAPVNRGDVSRTTQSATKVPSGVILVKGAWSSSSDSSTPTPESGSVAHGVYKNNYFGFTYTLPKNWTEEYNGPPPSDTGRYVLAQIQPANPSGTSSPGHILVTAQDMFFSLLPAQNSSQLAAYEVNNLQDDYRLDLPISKTKIAGQAFSFFAYWSPVAELHWYVLETEIRCHTLEFVFTSRDPELLKTLVLEMKNMHLTANPGRAGFPVCIKDYAGSKNLTSRVDPISTEHRFNPVPVRIIIDKQGKVKHIHFLSAFPDQQKAVSDALRQWKFKPYRVRGQPVEVETGVLFGAERRTIQTGSSSVD
jgi:Gram-negative bacterial TonB protein C-terminal